ncbi:MAG: hypothetical protein UW17_C0041G0007 [Candidatus Nomurabacteria bacterium GW2011_GWD1_44_10]|nr:MAG: hypothetical protein UW17_C0041G0007 [Candidatus Nomurabacteria bacterium GW2011_GWD1_44_10]
MRPKKRGRKSRRITLEPVRKYLTNKRVPLSRERGSDVGASRSARLRKERDTFNKKESWAPVPLGPLIMIADAVVKYRKGIWHTWFFILVRAVDEEDAVILPPYHATGRETGAGWHNAMEAVPSVVLLRVKALVSDGHCGLTSEAMWRHWHVQRCHIHLLMAIQARRSRWSMGRHQAEGNELHRLTQCVLNNPNKQEASQALSRIEEIGWTTKSKMLSKVLLGFVTSSEDYRTYLAYPELNLPATSNTAESLNALVDSLVLRARGFRTVASFDAWIIALCKDRKTIKCRGKYQQN